MPRLPQVSPSSKGKWRPGQPVSSSDRAAAAAAFDSGKGAAAKGSAALQPNALDPLMDALKDLFSGAPDALEEQARLCSLLSSHTQFLVSVFRYYCQRLTGVWSAAAQLHAAAAASLADERIDMCARSASRFQSIPNSACISLLMLVQVRRVAHAQGHPPRVQELQVSRPRNSNNTADSAAL